MSKWNVTDVREASDLQGMLNFLCPLKGTTLNVHHKVCMKGALKGAELHEATNNKKLLGAPGLTARSKDATRGSWHRYERSILTIARSY